jgi:5-methylcytosine-specific restriction protein A
MPQAIPRVLTAAGVLQALAELDGGVEHRFGPATGYELVHEGRRYPPKAVVGLACRSLIGRVLRPEEFSVGFGAVPAGGRSLPRVPREVPP